MRNNPEGGVLELEPADDPQVLQEEFFRFILHRFRTKEGYDRSSEVEIVRSG